MSRRSTKRNESLIETSLSVDETMSGSAISKKKNLSEMASGSITRNKKKSVSEPKAGPAIAKKSIKKTTKQKKRKPDGKISQGSVSMIDSRVSIHILSSKRCTTMINIYSYLHFYT